MRLYYHFDTFTLLYLYSSGPVCRFNNFILHVRAKFNHQTVQNSLRIATNQWCLDLCVAVNHAEEQNGRLVEIPWAMVPLHLPGQVRHKKFFECTCRLSRIPLPDMWRTREDKFTDSNCGLGLEV
jgi:hypothetical protein